MLARWRPSKVQFHLSKRNWYWHSRALMVMASLRVSATPGSRLHILRCFFSSLSRSHSLKWALPMLSSGKEFSGRTDNGSLPVNLEENITSHLETILFFLKKDTGIVLIKYSDRTTGYWPSWINNKNSKAILHKQHSCSHNAQKFG